MELPDEIISLIFRKLRLSKLTSVLLLSRKIYSPALIIYNQKKAQYNSVPKFTIDYKNKWEIYSYPAYEVVRDLQTNQYFTRIKGIRNIIPWVYYDEFELAYPGFREV